MNVRRTKKYFSFSLLTVALASVVFLVISACTDNAAKAKPNLVYKDAPRAGVVAKIGAKEVTEEDLIGDAKVSFFELKKREYDLKMSRLKVLMVDYLIGEKAKEAGMGMEDFIEKKVISGKLNVSDKEYKKFVADKKIPKAQINDKLKERIMDYLKENKKETLVSNYVAKLTKSSPVEVYFKKPKIDLVVEVGKAPTMGGNNAKVSIVEFSDFQCPFCARGAELINDVKAKYGNKVQVAFKHFPLPMHKEAKPASEASMCVHEQNKNKFWKYHDLIFENQRKLSDDDLVAYAKQVGVNEKKFKECYESGKYKQLVEDDLAYGEKLGVRSTPTFFVNGQLVSGAVPLEQISEIIDSELE